MAKRPVPQYDFKAFGAAIKAAHTERKESRKKVRAIKRAQGMAGEHLIKPPYGYIVSPADKKQ